MSAVLTHPGVPISLSAAAVSVLGAWLLFRAIGVGIRGALNADSDRKRRARELAAAVAQHALLFFFVAVAMGLSAQGLIAFACDNMRLAEPWPHLIFFALDGAAGMCAVLMARRAARGDSAVAPRLAVWGIVAASATFNWEQAPKEPGAHLAFAVFPVIGAVLFEFTLRETRRAIVRDAHRQVAGIRWLHPIERVRVLLALAADEDMTATAATRRVRRATAARRLYALRLALTGSGWANRLRVRVAERRAQAALVRANFTNPAEAVGVLRGVQVLSRARDLAALDYSTAEAARTVLANLITDVPAADPLTVDGWHSTVARPECATDPVPEIVPSGAPDADGTRDGTPGGTPDGTDAGTPDHANGRTHGEPPVPPSQPARRRGRPTKADEETARRVWRENHAAGISLTDRGLVAAVDKRVGRTAAKRIIDEERERIRASKAR